MRFIEKHQTGWAVSPAAEDAVLLASGRAYDPSILVYADDEENKPLMIDLPGGPKFGKRPKAKLTNSIPQGVESGRVQEITEFFVGQVGQQDGKRLPSPFLSYAKYVLVPAEHAGKRIFITLDQARYHVTLSIDGNFVAQYVGGLEPHRFDVTEHIIPGERTLVLVTVGDVGVSGHKVFDPYNYTGTRLPTCKEIENNHVHPVHYGGSDRALGYVTLEALPAVRVDYVFADPKVSAGVLEYKVALVNDSDKSAKVRIKSSASPLNSGGAEKLLVDDEVHVPAKSAQTFGYRIKWEDAVLWDTDNPFLYGLKTSLVENGRKIDEHSDYFGFREFTINGHSFYLNGKKIRLLGQSGHISEPQANRPLEWKVKFFRDWMEKGNCNHARLHARVQDKSWVEAADRAGMLITTETALWTTGFHSFDFAGSEEECYQNVRKHFMDALVRRDRNNPSVVIWSFSNEMSPILPTDVNISPKMAAATRVFKKIIDEAEEEDQSRIVQMSSAMDFIGNLKMYNLHYPKNWQGFPDHPHTQYWLEGSFLFPWYGARKYEYPSWGWRKNKPLYFGEFTCVFGATPDNQSTIVGDAAFEDADFGTERVDDKLWPAEVNSYRRLDVSGFCAWAAMFGPDYDDVTEWVKGRGKAAFVRAQRYIAVIDHSYRTKYIAGDDVPIELSVHNDTRSERTLELCCKVYDGEECIWTETMPSARFGPAELLAFTNRFRAPLTESKKELVYHAALTSDGNLADEWKKTIEIHPKSVGKSLPNDCAFLDPDGILAEMLSKRGITGGIFIDELEGAELDSCKTLWLNFKESKLRGGDWKKIRRKVERFVKNGGYAIIDNAEAALTDLPIEVKNGTGFAAGERLEITYAYLAAPFNPAVKGFVESDFSLWGEDYYVARRCYENPQSGNAIPILVAGADRGGLTKTPLMEIIYGSGAYLVSSLELFAKLGEAPIAAELIVSFAGAGPSVKLKETGLCLTDESIARMREVGMESENVGAAEALGKDIAIIDGLFYKESLIPQIKASLSGGGTVCLHALDEAQTGSVLKGLSLPGSVAPGEIGDGVWDSVTHTFNKEGGNWDAVRHAHRLADGMTGNHLFWIEGKGKLAPWTSATHHPKPASACVALGGEEGGFALTRRGAAVVYEAFGGILVIDNLRWQMDDIEEPERARRYLACLLTNLGAGLTEGVEKRMGIDYETAEERRERGHF